ncbi:MAG: tRNA (adenosine(37)-N6)-threonylcarbamoyltransferase complex ATPase subunit type 1 TsaE [Lachnospirales bacterium]
MIIETYNEDETFNIGSMTGQETNKGDIFCLKGDLGVGKTIFSKGFAHGLKIEDEITSPTYTIVNIYEGIKKLYHFDVYRINDIEEMENIGYEEIFFGNGVCLIEWAEKILDILPENIFWVKIEKDLSKGENYRKITIE